ncbi:MAG: alpha/beta fold hydrolase [Acidimicrobiales bacterium]
MSTTETNAELVTERFATAVGDIQLTRGGDPSRIPVVYLHSSGGETGSNEVAEFLGLLAADHALYAPMLPGFAGSEGLDQLDDIEDAVYHTLDVFDRLGLGADNPPHVAGMSLGGWLAAELAWRHPERVRSLTLINAVGLYVPGAPMSELFGRKFDELATEVFADQTHPVAAGMHLLGSLSPKDLAGVPFELVRPYFESMAAAAKFGWNPYFHNPKMSKRLVRVTAPTLVILGRKDGLVPNAVGEEYARLIADARLEYVDEGSHMLTLENPEAVTRLMNDHFGG